VAERESGSTLPFEKFVGTNFRGRNNPKGEYQG